MHRLSYSSRGSIVIEWAIPAVQTTVELCRTNTVLFGSGGPIVDDISYDAVVNST